MRLLIEISGPLKDWHAALNPQIDRPRLPLPFSVSAAFIQAGHEVSAISFTDDSFPSHARERFWKLYGPGSLEAALAENDVAFFWARSGIRAVRRDRSNERKVVLASYVWQINEGIHLRSRMLAFATRAAARRARALVFMTDEQVSQASESLSADRPIAKFTWGIDSSFYAGVSVPPDVSDVSRLTREPYVILAGDQQRLDSDAVRLAAEFGIRVARVPQESKTADWYRNEISKRGLEDRLFVFEKVSYATLRYLLQNAAGYVGLVDSTWQPAGWTVLCEAFASGLPAVIYEGLTAREMRRLGAGNFLVTTRQGNVDEVAQACRRFMATGERSRAAQHFARDVLDLEKTAPAFVAQVERIVRPAKNQLGIKTLLAHPGTQHSFHLARELERLGALDAFYTGVAWRPGGKLDRIMRFAPGHVSRRLGNRRLQLPFQTRVERRTAIELVALWKTTLGHEEQQVMYDRNQRFQESIPSEALAAADAVVGVDTGSWILARRCRELRRPFILDQSIGHPDAKQQMHQRVRNQYPDWDEGFEARLTSVREAEISEQRDATAIVAASTFTKQTLVENGVAPEKVHVVPYGVDCRRFHLGDRTSDRPFRFVFVGAVTARKGIPLLADAWRKLNPPNAELWLIGPTRMKARRLLSRIPGLHMKQAVPQREVPALLQQCDVFVFPSYFEGFGLVLLEAMACGLPVITTTATAGPDLVTNGGDGWTIQPGDLDALAMKMETCLASRSEVREMSVAARRTAERFTWESYGERWVEILNGVKASA